MERSNYWDRWMRTGRTSRRSLLQKGAVTGAGLGAFALVGCGDDDDDDTGSPTGTATAGASATREAPTAPSGDPVSGGRIAIAWYGSTSEQPNLDPHQSATQLLQALGSGVAYSRLMRYDFGPGVAAGSTNPTVDTAASFEQPDDRTYLFKIRPEAKWQNIAPVSGRKVTAEDVAYSFQRQIDLKVNASALGDMESIRAIDDETLEIITPEPDVDFVQTLGAPWNKIVAREVVEQFGDLKEAPVIGAGPWIHEEWINGSIVRFRRNPDYWLKDEAGRPLPYADELHILRIPDRATAIAAWEQGQFLVLRAGSAPPEFERIVSSNKDKAYIVDARELRAPGSNLFTRIDAAPTSDPRVRQALSLALDREQLLAGATFGTGYYGIPCTVPDPSTALTDDELRQRQPYDPNEAKRLLQEAGVSNWNPIMKFLFLSTQKDLSELIHPMLRDIGIGVDLESCDNVCNQTAHSQSDFELLLSAGLRGTTATSDLELFVKSGGSRNAAKISDPDLDRLIAQQKSEFKPEARRELLIDIQRRIMDQYGYLQLVSGSQTGQIVRNELKNWYYDGNFEYDIYTRAWVEA